MRKKWNSNNIQQMDGRNAKNFLKTKTVLKYQLCAKTCIVMKKFYQLPIINFIDQNVNSCLFMVIIAICMKVAQMILSIKLNQKMWSNPT